MTHPSRTGKKIIGIVQARMRSTRLSGKLMLRIGRKSILRWVLDRAGRARCLHAIVVATSTAAADDCLAQCCERWEIPCFRGSETDVLGRLMAAAETYDAGWIVRINADNPLVDPAYIDELTDAAVRSGADYQSYRRSDGKPVMLTALSFFTEVLTRDCLRRADREIVDSFQREHVTLGVYSRPERFNVHWLQTPAFCSDRRLRFTIDTQADYEMVREVVHALGDRVETAGAEEIVRLVQDHPDWLQAMAEGNRLNPKNCTSELE